MRFSAVARPLTPLCKHTRTHTVAQGVVRWLVCRRTLRDGRVWRRVILARTCAVNRIGDAGAKEVAEALKANTTLTTLDLSGALPGGRAASRAAAHAHALAHGRAWHGALARVPPHAA